MCAGLDPAAYKRANNSVVDNLFTGQMVESRRCLNCGCTAVSCSTFNVLPVPLAEPRLDGCVSLAACLQQLGSEVAERRNLNRRKRNVSGSL